MSIRNVSGNSAKPRYAEYKNNKYIRYIGSAAKLEEYLVSAVAGTELVTVLQERPDLVTLMGNAPKRVFAANRNAKLKRVINPIPVGDVYYADPPCGCRDKQRLLCLIA